jgi:hypothetical protein
MSYPYTYAGIVNQFQTACNEHLAINFFSSGTLDKLDAASQNVPYPYAFLRPLSSQGINLNANGISGTRSLTFELYMLDVPKLTDTDYTKLLSQTETYLYDIIAYFNLGAIQQDFFCTLQSITPVNEAFNDRVCGWVATIVVNTDYVLDFCNFPKL